VSKESYPPHTFEDINIGVAVALSDGLIVPVIMRADTLDVLEIQNKLNDLIDRARQDKLSQADISGGTFTISNFGMYGIKYFTPIINQKETAILGIGKIEEELRRINGESVPFRIVPLSLTLDHRIVDGIIGAIFLRDLVQMIERP
jgi:pyruvate dehydrogenase E2 component (dihydrolipoamide acetyltransferase)